MVQDGLKWEPTVPENLLAYFDFDGTYRISNESSEGEATATKELHRYAAHVQDYRDGDPTWQEGKGKGLIGAVNYLSEKGMNSILFPNSQHSWRRKRRLALCIARGA